MSRGGRQGNNAFLEYKDLNHRPDISSINNRNSLILQDDVSIELFQAMERINFKIHGGNME